VLSSGTAFSDRLKHALHERADITVTDAIASSEGGPYAFGVTASVGDLPTRFHPTSDTMVIGPDDREVRAGSGEIGMLAFAGPQALGYHKDAGGAATTFRVIAGRRYAVPGDLAELEADGAIRFLGRGSGVINTGGEKVHPKEVEDALLTHPGVTDCVVLGVPDETWGERVTAIVVAPGTTSPLELQDRVRSELAGYKVPRTVVVLDALPRTPSGKLELAWARRTVGQRLAAGGTTGSGPG
jgi:3-oxocholest-4-en-26-oate---CoA ligase